MKYKQEPFAMKLRAWRGQRTQKEAAFALQVDVDIYRKWEQGSNEPHLSPSLAEIVKRMDSVKS
jgi:DNA-binding transcriptional regulator YiaG